MQPQPSPTNAPPPPPIPLTPLEVSGKPSCHTQYHRFLMTNPQPLALLPVPHGCLRLFWVPADGFALVTGGLYLPLCVCGGGEAGLRRQPLVSVAWAEPPVFQINRARHVVCALSENKTKQNKKHALSPR